MKERTKLKSKAVERFAELFAGRTDARGTIDGGCVRETVDLETYRRHLRGDESLGLYMLQDGDLTDWGAVDYDENSGAKGLKAIRRVARALRALGAKPLFGTSKMKGYHCWVFFSKPVPAQLVRRLLKEAITRARVKAEVFPKQDHLADTKKGIGNYLNLPYYGSAGNGRRIALNPKTREPLSITEFLQLVKKTDPGNISLKVDEAEDKGDEFVEVDNQAEEDDLDTAVEAIKPHWVKGQRHKLALAVAGAAAKIGLPHAMSNRLIERLVEEAGDDEDRTGTLRDTYRKLRDGQAVKGYRGLVELLPQPDVDAIMEALASAHAPESMRQVDAIRLAKGAAFKKNRKIARVVETTLREGGKLIRTDAPTFFWQPSESRQLLRLNSAEFAGHVNRAFGINPQESLFAYIIEELKSAMLAEDATEVYRLYRFDEASGVLYVHLGPGAVAVLDGKVVREERNGDPVLFEGAGLGLDQVPKKRGKIDLVKKLAASVRFDAFGGLLPKQQRVLLEYALRLLPFIDRAKTRPILALIGPKGSGKTLAFRRIMKVYCGPEAEVSSLGNLNDAETASIEAFILSIDNFDERNRWQNDFRAKTSTGHQIERRELYTTARVLRFQPRC